MTSLQQSTVVRKQNTPYYGHAQNLLVWSPLWLGRHVRIRSTSQQTSRTPGSQHYIAAIQHIMTASTASTTATAGASIDADFMLGRRCSYWILILFRTPKHRRIPIATTFLFVTCVVVFYTVEGRGAWYGPGELPNGSKSWHSPIGAMVSHINDEHLWQNMLMHVLLGWFYELTEGPLATCGVLWGPGLLGFAMHGAVKPKTLVRGASGAIYGVMWAQLSLLALNWKEMPGRWVRLFFCLFLMASDIGIYWFWRRPGISYESHLFGGVAGIAFALTCGENVRLRKWELSLNWLGVLLYAALVAAGVAAGQNYASGLAAILIPVLVGRAARDTRNALAICGAKPRARDALDEILDGATTGSTPGPAGAVHKHDDAEQARIHSAARAALQTL